MLNKDTAKSLAIQYQSFCEVDLTQATHIDIYCRAQSLLEAQQNTGVELHDNEWLKQLSDRHWAAFKAGETQELAQQQEKYDY